MKYLWLLAVTACSLNVDYTGTNYQCNADGTCPTNFICESKVCVPVDPAPPACSKAVATGGEHACAVRNDGTVWCWGANDFGQLGDNTATDSEKPVQVAMLTDAAIAVAAGDSTSCALTKKGDVWCWGHNDAGELGDGTNSDSRTPVQVKGVSGVTAIAVGSGHACALGGDGSVLCWGSNDDGQLGDGTTSDRNMAIAVPGLPAATAISCGDDTSCAVDGSGVLRCWGQNSSGQLGDGTMTSAKTPTAVKMLPPVVGVAAGGGFTCANDAGGAVWCWGDNTNATLGNGDMGGMSVTPVQVLNASPLHQLVAGSGQACGRDDQQRLWCWGINYDARLGDGTYNSYDAVPTLSLMTSTVAMATGGEHTCAVDSKGAVRCAGFNRRGQLGNGQRITQGAPQKVPGIANAIAVTAGGAHSCAALADGTVKCWGANDAGQLGDGNTLDSASPVDAVQLGGVTALTAGGDHTCAISGGSVFCWGNDDSSQLGTMSTFDSPVPQYVSQLGGGRMSVTLGDSSTCVIDKGQAYCVGNIYGDTITAVGGFSDVKEVAIGRAHTCVLRSSGSVECWGSDSNGQLGDGNCCSSNNTPTAVPGLPSVQHLYARGNETCVLAADGSARCWGYDDSYRLGNGQSTYSVSSPVTVMGLAGAMSISMGFDANCARKSDGSVACWGPGYFGQIGDGQYASRGMATPIPGLSGVMQIAPGGSHVCALLGDGTVSCWGMDDRGQLGDGVHALVHPQGVEMTCP